MLLFIEIMLTIQVVSGVVMLHLNYKTNQSIWETRRRTLPRLNKVK